MTHKKEGPKPLSASQSTGKNYMRGKRTNMYTKYMDARTNPATA